MTTRVLSDNWTADKAIAEAVQSIQRIQKDLTSSLWIDRGGRKASDPLAPPGQTPPWPIGRTPL